MKKINAFPISEIGTLHAIGRAAIADIDENDVDARDVKYSAAQEEAGRGMTLRDYFAAHAPDVPDMQTFPIKQWHKTEIINLGGGMKGPREVLHQESWVERSVRWAGEYADAMIAERAK